MKKLINETASLLPDMLNGMLALDPRLARLAGQSVVLRADAAAMKGHQVALISGGGSGHEPAHAGYVGAGMLSAAVLGEIFTSPSADAVLAAIQALASPAGVLLIVKNYTGDRLNFGLAAELARAQGIPVELVIVADDVALAANGATAGRRGLAGTILVHKIAGAAAAEGLALVEVAHIAREAAAAVGTMGVALSPCTVPAVGAPSFQLGEQEIEWGLGIHGEAGVRRGALEPAQAIVDHLVERLVHELALQPEERVALLVNNLGNTPPSELDIAANAALHALRQHRLVVERAWSGTFLTALDMAGISLSLLRLDQESRLARLDAPTQARAWPSALGPVAQASIFPAPPPVSAPSPTNDDDGPRLPRDSALRRAIDAICHCLKEAEPLLTQMDQRTGDGDLGLSLERAVAAIQAKIDDWPGRPSALLLVMATTVRRAMGGTSGPLYAILLARAAQPLEAATEISASTWAKAFAAGVAGVMELGGAQPGDRTMIDALYPASEALQQTLAESSQDLPAALAAAVQAAQQGAACTANMAPRRGRSSYIGERALGTPDPGAHAVALWLQAAAQALGNVA